jgi:endonuclease YncB( thermonuclease family)
MDAYTAPPAQVRVIDGDTIRVGSEVIRLENIDTPEVGNRAECDSERLLAQHASEAMRQIISSARGPVTIERRGKDRFQRTLARVTIAGRDIGLQMIELGFAVPWKGRVHDWCGAPRR